LKPPRLCGHVFEAHRLLYYSTLGLGVVKKKKKGDLFLFRLLGRVLKAHRLLYHPTLCSEKGATRAENAQWTPTQSHMSPSILVYEDKEEEKDLFLALAAFARAPREGVKYTYIYIYIYIYIYKYIYIHKYIYIYIIIYM